MSSKKSLISFEEAFFFIKVFLVYGCWKVLHGYLWRTPESKYAWQSKLVWYANLYTSLISRFVNLLGHPATATGNVVHMDGYGNMIIVEHCLAIPAMFVFAFSLLLFKGKASEKLWFIPLGLVGIFIINLVRLISLAFFRMWVGDAEIYDVMHRYVFLTITYGAIMLMVVWWMDRTMKKAGPAGKAPLSGAMQATNTPQP